MLRMVFIFIPFILIYNPMKSQVEITDDIKVLNFDQLEPYLHKNNDTVYLVNFWATWCAPCIKELPVIQAVEAKYVSEKFKVLLVSLDFPGQLNSKLVPFLKSKDIKSEVILLDDPDQNRWINLVDKNWSGAIPFTLIYGKDFRDSYAHSFDFETLDTIINLKLKP